MQTTKIQWATKTWNPISGCTKVSAGCKNCYAERLHSRFASLGNFSKIRLNEHKINEPARMREPQVIFVNSMSDFFHEAVPYEYQLRLYEVMCINQQHTYLILTKRPQNAVQFFKQLAYDVQKSGYDSVPSGSPYWRHYIDIPANIWIGISAEYQTDFEQRMHQLVQIPCNRFVSAEPLLGPIEIEQYASKIHWLITGGESGPLARPMLLSFAWQLFEQCRDYNIPFFFKQWGEWRHYIVPPPIKQSRTRLYKLQLADGMYYRVGKRKAGTDLFGKHFTELPKFHKRHSCNATCSPSDFYPGGKCDKNGCYM